MVPQVPVWVPDKTGRFILRPKYSTEELEAVCEDAISDLLNRRHGKVDPPVTEDDLIVLLESSGVEVELDADFSKELGWVQGQTEFRTDKAAHVSIAKSLSEVKSCGNRFRFTLGHEWGHAVLLRDAYLREGNVCKEGSWRLVCNPDMAGRKPQRNWAEWQADHCGGALLIPRPLLELIIGPRPDRRSEVSHSVFSVDGRSMIARVSESFQTSFDAARVRLLRLGYLHLPARGRQLDFQFTGVEEGGTEIK